MACERLCPVLKPPKGKTTWVGQMCCMGAYFVSRSVDFPARHVSIGFETFSMSAGASIRKRDKSVSVCNGEKEPMAALRSYRMPAIGLFVLRSLLLPSLLR
ncbi:Piso0_004471 [Millerozyma farinosa CBS 7064]|uniref:Piso0_004471 protein n=1 Tax=Pichia sorbitophila (strain ATCC MYA-4447 / BCRC 22081 / CBS 7064 / NBRC 10061 / NRRL Y-12695) TaxID=559304 RepID=G8Y8W2_PICSO|nr:Piso0_004471 [Millerozyma farinosa CBS 7064]CCE84907.1 Piso0_004471 [Millerozyma farinosa CBS 7064]